MSDRPRKKSKLAPSRAELKLTAEIASAARRAHELHAKQTKLRKEAKAGGQQLDALLAHLESGVSTSPPLMPQRAEFLPTEECTYERNDEVCLKRLKRSPHGLAVLKALRACSEVDSDQAHWEGPFGAELRALVDGRGSPNPNIRVMRAADPSVNPVALLTPPGEPALAAVAAQHIAAGTPVALYTGELVVDGEDSELPSSTYVYKVTRDFLQARGYPDDLPAPCMDAYRGGLARFVNDKWTPQGWPTRTPNVYMDTVYDGTRREVHLCFFASAPIAKGRELIVDYGPEYWATALRLLLAAHVKVVRQLEGRLGGKAGASSAALKKEEDEEEDEDEEEEEDEDEEDEEEGDDGEEGEEDDEGEEEGEIFDLGLERLRERLATQDLDLILFDDLPEAAEGEEEERTLASLLKLEHLLLPLTVAKLATEIAESMRGMCAEWDEDETALSDALVVKILRPKVAEAAQAVAAARWPVALGTLLGLLLFCSIEDGWLLENRCHQEWPSWCALFEHLSDAWRAVLAKDDRTLGLRPKGGRPEGYRPKLVALLRGWQEEANEALAGYDGLLNEGVPCMQVLTTALLPPPLRYDGLLGGGLARVTACADETKEKKEKKRKK